MAWGNMYLVSDSACHSGSMKEIIEGRSELWPFHVLRKN